MKHIWRTPEICDWKDVIGKVKPEDNLCNIVAVYLSGQKSTGKAPVTTTKTGKEPVTPTKHHTPYECFKMAINNVKTKLGMKPKKKVIYCPKTVILAKNANASNTSTRLQHPKNVDGFLIGRGDYRRNSIRVYRFHNGGKLMNLVLYMYNVSTTLELEIEKNEYSDLRQPQLQRSYELSGARTADERFLHHLKDKKIIRNPLNKSKCKVKLSIFVKMSSISAFSSFHHRIVREERRGKYGNVQGLICI